MATIVNTGGGGAAVKFNVFCQPTEPTEKNGIWLKTSIKVSPKKIVFDTSYWGEEGWVTPSPVAEYSQNLKNSCCAVYKNKIYFWGGETDTGSWAMSFLYDVAENNYKVTASTSDGYPQRSDAMCATCGDYIYVIGGLDKNDTIIPHILKYSPETNSYSKVCNMQSRRYSSCCSVYNNKIYMFGGLNGSSTTLNSAEVFDPDSKSCTTISALPDNRSGSCCETYGDKIYIFGGYMNGFKGTVYEYNPETNTYSTLNPMPESKSWACSCLIGDEIFIFGGKGNLNLIENTVLAYNPNTKTFRYAEPLPTGKHSSCCAQVNDRVYVFFGYKSTSSSYGSADGDCLSLTSKQYPDNPTAILYYQPNDHTHMTSLLATKLIDYLPVYFKDAMLFKDGDVTFPAVYSGDGTAWNLIREEQ